MSRTSRQPQSGRTGCSPDRRLFLQQSLAATAATATMAWLGKPLSAAEGEGGKLWVAAIGVNGYERVQRLRYCVQDAQAVAEYLSRPFRRAEMRESALEPVNGAEPRTLLMTDRSPPRLQPTLDNIQRELREFLKKPAVGDRVVIHFSGHGAIGQNGQSYLMSRESDPAHVGLSGLSVVELREMLRNCRADPKFMFLDACHAHEMAPVLPVLTANQLQADLDGVGGLFGIASCRSDEQSLEWENKGHGVFTYWLLQGLAGGADAEGDARITFDELYKFVHSECRFTARMVFNKSQQPVRIVGQGVPEVKQVGLEPVSQVLHRVAEVLHQRLLSSNCKLLAVREFSNRVEDKSELRGSLGTFGVLAAERVERQLIDLGTDPAAPAAGYRLFPGTALRSHLKNITLAMLDEPIERKRLAQVTQVDTIAVGEFSRYPDPDRLVLRCQLRSLKDGSVLGGVTGVVQVDAELLAMLGVSGEVQEVNPFSGVALPSLYSRLSDAADKPHPQSDMNAEPPRLAISFWAAGGPHGRTRKVVPVARGGDRNKLYLGFHEGEEYKIVLESQVDEVLAVRVFVDGLNVLGATPELRNVIGDEKRPKYELPQESWPFIFDGRAKLELDSFHRDPRRNGNGRVKFGGGKFVVGPVARSLASQQGLGDSVGQITILAYRVKGIDRSGELGTVEGQLVEKVYRTVDLEADDRKLVASYVFRYLDADVLAREEN